MAYSNFFDANPVIIDDLGNPLQGRVKFFDYNTVTYKGIYEDVLGTSAANPQYTDTTGKLENQIFLGAGSYFAVFQRYLGTSAGNMQTAPEGDFLTFKSEDLIGSASDSSPVNINGTEIATIADLRLVNPSVFNKVVVLGYYAINDNIVPRTYFWNANSVANDNFGTVIKCTSLGTGRWEMAEPEEMDVKYFGIFPGYFTYNSQLTALIGWMSSSLSHCKTIRFGTGTYTFLAGTFNFITKVILEQNVKFDIGGAGTLHINFNADYDIQTVNPLVINKAALNLVIIKFTATNASLTNKIIKSEWYGNWADLVHGDEESIALMESRVGTGYTIQVGSTYYIKATANISHNTVFNNGSYFSKGGNIIFNNCDVSNVGTNTPLNCTTWTNLRFIGSTVRATCFGSSYPNLYLDCQTNSSNSTFIFDKSVTFTGQFMDNGGFKYIHQYGIISTQTAEVYAQFQSIECNNNMFGDTVYVAINNQPVKITWFMPNTYSQSQGQTALINATRCAMMGSGHLDLCNKVLNISSGVTILGTNPNNSEFSITNGRINATADLTLLTFKYPCAKLEIKDIFYYAPSNNTTFLTMNKVGIINATIGDLIIRDSKFYLNISSIMIQTLNSGNIVTLKMDNNEVTMDGGYMLANPNLTNCFLTNNKIKAQVTAQNSYSKLSTNEFNGCDRIDFTCKNSLIINDNRLYKTDLRIHSNDSMIDAVVTGNQFESTNDKYSRIFFEADTALTNFAGSVVNGNSFSGHLSANMIPIVLNGTYNSAGHKINISNNIGKVDLSNIGIHVPSTVGSGLLESYVAIGTQNGKIHTVGYNEGIIFDIPASTQNPTFLSNLHSGGIYYISSNASDGGGKYYQVAYNNVGGDTIPVIAPGQWSIYT